MDLRTFSEISPAMSCMPDRSKRTRMHMCGSNPTSIRGLLALLSGMMFVSFAVPSFGDEATWGVRLMRPDCLIGWDYYPKKPPRGWKIQDGRLQGDGQSEPLLSGYSFGDFELRFDWLVTGESTCCVLLPKAPSGLGLEWILGEGKGGCRLISGDAELARGTVTPMTEGRTHHTALRRIGGKMEIVIDDRRICEAAVPNDHRFGLGLAATGESVVVADLRATEPVGEPIFNGADLTGWWTPGDITGWAAEKGSIVRTTGDRNFLRTRREFGNFTLSLEYRIAEGGNSGIGIRTPQAGWPSRDGMEMQIYDQPLDMPLDEHSQMAIYGGVPPLVRADKPGQWNRVVIKADGGMISAWVNGQLVQQYNTSCHPELKHHVRKGWIGFQDHHAGIEVRDIRVLEAPEGAGLDAWQVAPEPTLVTMLLDRLLNPESISRANGITSGLAAGATSSNRQAQVLARLTGPGALVRVACDSRDGRLAFFFDDDPIPRIECRPADLWQVLPFGIENNESIDTCLPYNKSLRIELIGGRPAAYRFEYVQAPSDMAVQTFTTIPALAPRGWLAAVTYRVNQYGWGVHRDYDPSAYFRSPQRMIESGKTVELMHVNGAGIVNVVTILADKRVLDNNDLWLEVTVDGKHSPAIAAPCRFWYPGLAGRENYPNFVLVERNGVANTLAMPYGDGITFSVSNHGKQPIHDVGVTISVNQATEQTQESIARRMRLNGVFQPAGKDRDTLVDLQGCGRWIGLVYQQPEDRPNTVESMMVDGKSIESWQSTSLDALWGGKGDFQGPLGGRHEGLCWRYLLLSPVDFEKSLQLKTTDPKLGDRLAFFYTVEDMNEAKPTGVVHADETTPPHSQSAVRTAK